MGGSMGSGKRTRRTEKTRNASVGRRSTSGFLGQGRVVEDFASASSTVMSMML